ncbi:MAG TPA: ABC transporter substrate-binding protein [Candidatus Lustribacter sp.]|jgi:ABC-type nitrate/sulfonate/bicarbonate transport system substrate-binding protein|nr:ABC transporter substrate-binding protein [Candidatus Lustribacter sp.]
MKKVWLVLLALLLLPVSGVAQTSPPDPVKLLINPGLIFDLPLMIAIDKGLFAQQHLAVQVIVHSGSSQVIIPELVRGDVDVAGISANPGFFNQFAQGFDAKIIASSSSSKKGWNPIVWLVVRQSDWDAGTIRKPRDIAGKHFDGATPGGEGWYLSRHLMTEAALQPSDLFFTEKFTTAPDWILSLRNINDIQAVYEPTVTQFEQQKIGHRWLSIMDVDPSYQEAYLGASAKVLKARPDVIRRFLIAYVKASKILADGNGKWTPDVLAIFAKYSGLSPDIINAIPTPPYTGEYGTIHTASLEKIQRFWKVMGLVNAEQPIDTLADPSFITAAQRAAGVTVPKH